jgi:hypothetical protein
VAGSRKADCFLVMDGIGVSRAMLETWQSEVCHHDHLPLCSSEEEDLVALLALAQGKDVEGEELCGACVLGLREAVWVVVEEGEGRDGGRFGSFMAVEGQECLAESDGCRSQVMRSRWCIRSWEGRGRCSRRHFQVAHRRSRQERGT